MPLLSRKRGQRLEPYPRCMNVGLSRLVKVARVANGASNFENARLARRL